MHGEQESNQRSCSEAKIRYGLLEMEALRASKVRRIGQDAMCFVEQPNYSEVTPQQLQEQYQQPLQPPRDPRDPAFSGHHHHHHHHPSISQQPPNSAPRLKYSNYPNDRPRRGGGFRGKARRIR